MSQTTLHYGTDCHVTFEFAPDVLVADCDAPRGTPLGDPAAATAAALDDPLALPALTQLTVPGDRIAVALEEGLPRSPEIVAAVVTAFIEGGTQPENITVVRTPRDARGKHRLPTSRLAADTRDRIEVITHDPNDRGSLSYLAASRDAEPIYINRTLCDADVVLPIGALRPASSLGYLGIHGGIFPTFADKRTQRRFQAAASSLSERQHKKRVREVEEAAWLLGIQMVLQVVPGACDEVLHVLAGAPAAVWQRGRQRCEAAWRFSIPQRASLVIAAMEGSRTEQTWQNFTRALAVALDAVEDDGAVAICSQLQSRLGPALKRVAGAASLEEARRAVRRVRAVDALPATQLVHALQRVKVYLLSELDEQVVEDLGLIYVSRAAEIANLIKHHSSCIVLASAQRATVALGDPVPRVT